MNGTLFLSLVAITVAVVMAGLSIPMILRRVPRNRIYGVRFKASLKSDKNWYEINEYGGKALLLASVPIAACGVAGMLLRDGDSVLVLWGVPVVIVTTVLIATGLSYFRACRVDKESGLKHETPR